MQGMRIDYLPWSPFTSLQSYGIASAARLQREELSTSKQEHRETSSNSTGIYMGMHPLLNLQTFLILQITRQRLTNLLEVLHLSKLMANIIKLEKIYNNGSPFDCFPFSTLPMASGIDGNGIFVRVPGVFAVLLIFFLIDALVLVAILINWCFLLLMLLLLPLQAPLLEEA
jgi:hypothetical protein